MKCCHLSLAAIILLLTCLTTARAETRFVSDQLVISLRELPRDGAPAITYLRTDTPVEVLEENGDYLKVETRDGQVGYVKGHYLTAQTPKSTLINKLQKEVDRLSARAGEMKEKAAVSSAQNRESQQEMEDQLAAMRKQARDMEVNYKKSQAALAELEERHRKLQEDAKNVVQITRERDQLRSDTQTLSEEVARLDKEAQSLMTAGSIKWFLAGGGVLFFGWVIGKMSGNRRRRSLL